MNNSRNVNAFGNAILFSRDEFASRVARAKEKMVDMEVDLLLVASPANQFYLTGYDGWSFYTPQMVVVSLDTDQPMWIGRAMDAVGAKFTAFMDPEYIIAYPDEYVGSSALHPMQYVADIIRERSWANKRIAVEMDDYYYTARWHEILTSRLSDATFSDGFLAINQVRMVKSEHELKYMMESGKITEAAMHAAVDAAKPGVRQCDVIAELNKVTTGGTADIGGTFTCKPPNAMVGEYCSAPHLSWTDAILEPDEMFYIEMGGCRHRYHTPLSRCVFLGTPPQAMADLANVIAEGLHAALETAKTGALCEDLEAAWRKVISRHGIEKDARLGYPVGIGYPPTWGELTASLRKGDKTVLEKNMTFHCIPALWMENYGLVISESFVVTDQGAKTFADFPRQLFSL